MKELTGSHLAKFPFQNLFKVGDLVYYDGPLLSLFSNNEGELYLFGWADSNDKYNRWLVFQITLTQLTQYLNKNISHYQLITTHFSDYFVSVDIDDDLSYHNVTLLHVVDIPGDYLPDRDVIHQNDETPHIDRIKAYINQLALRVDEDRERQLEHTF